jgi:hypothetical protein
VPKAVLRRTAFRWLAAVGDPRLGQWEEWHGYAYHVRRRLAAAEQAAVGPVVDVRGTPEAWRRYEAVKDRLPAELARMALDEVEPPKKAG